MSTPVLCGKLTVNFSLSVEQYEKLTPDQESAMTDTAKLWVRRKLEAVLAEANDQVKHLGMTITLHEDL